MPHNQPRQGSTYDTHQQQPQYVYTDHRVPYVAPATTAAVAAASSTAAGLNTADTDGTSSGCQLPLPEGWDIGRDYDGKIYFIDHRSQTTTWADPREAG